MAENNWKTPGAVIGIITAFVAIAGLYFKYKEDELSKRKEDNQVQVDASNRRREEDKVIEIQRIRQEKIDRIQSQITEIDTQIKHCRDMVGSAQWEAKACLTKQEGDCQVYIDQAKHYTAEWNKLENEEKELQKQLSSL